MKREQQIVPIPLGFVKAFLVRGEGHVLVDAGYPGRATAIRRVLAEHGLKPADLSLILITHGHTDHFGSAAAMQADSEAPLAVGRADSDALRQGANGPTRGSNALFDLAVRLGSRVAQTAPSCEADVLLDGEISLDPYGIKAQVIPTPGHTPGAISILLPDGQALVGDLVMGGFLGRGRPSAPIVWSDPEAHRESVRRLLAVQPRLIHTSHGGPFSLEEVQRRQKAVEGRR